MNLEAFPFAARRTRKVLLFCALVSAWQSATHAGFLSLSSDGSDGAFVPVANTILPGGTYNFTSVSIPAGVTVTVTGTVPLQIYSQGLVDIAGVLDMSGQDGETNISYLNSPITYGGAGGGGGGWAGGTGGALPSSYVPPTAGQGPGGGGGAGNGVSAVPVGSGGGGAGNASPGWPGVLAITPSLPTSPPGTAGAAYGDSDPFTLVGGSGGGGGDFGQAFNGVGGGGGGGGGAALIWSDLSISVTGSLLATGGDGGDVINRDGGGGGGGSGGAIWLEAPAVFASGLLDALGGLGGNTNSTGGGRLAGAGADGAPGRIRIDAYTFTGDASPAPLVNIVPEPSTLVLAAVGILALFVCGKRTRAAAAMLVVCIAMPLGAPAYAVTIGKVPVGNPGGVQSRGTFGSLGYSRPAIHRAEGEDGNGVDSLFSWRPADRRPAGLSPGFTLF